MFGIEDLCTVGEVDPYQLGATSSVFGRSGEYGRRDRYVPRTASMVDERLARALAGEQLVVLVGPSKAGKTRTLFEAVRSYDPSARVVWPVSDGIGELTAHPRIADSDDTLVVWLDDLHEYLTGAVPLTPAALARLSSRCGRTVAVATLRSEMRAQMRREGELRQETRMLLDQALTIDLASTSDDPAENVAAARAYPHQTIAGHGLGEVLAGAPELLARYNDARAADPQLHAVIAVAVDWARIGRTEPIPEPVLVDLTFRQLRSTHPHIDATPTSVLDAATEARTPPPGAGRTAALHTSYIDADTRGYRAFDYLIAADDGQDHRAPRPIPETYWHDATRDCDAETLVTVGTAAYRRAAEPTTALTLFRKAADAGNPNAMHNLGVLFAARDDKAEANTWYQQAAEAGNTRAMTNLGVLLNQRGNQVQAEAWYRQAAGIGDAGAMHNLGILLEGRGDQVEAEAWYRKGADAGSTGAMTALGILLAKRDDEAEAEAWLRKAAGIGGTNAMASLGFLLA
uniref:tetratricopeptide repeat protein n=1 Tax=Nocardia testacea TaxID=248551 RepID=UPI0012F68242